MNPVNVPEEKKSKKKTSNLTPIMYADEDEVAKRIRDLSMAGKLEIQWSTVPNKFITWGNEICLYEILPPITEPYPPHVFKISDSKCAKLITSNTNHVYVKGVDIYPKCETDLLLAVAQPNGRVALSTFGPAPEHEQHSYPGRELVPRHGRNCNDVLFNRVEPNLLAVALDKWRADGSVLVWDINQLTVAGLRSAATSSTSAMSSSAPGAVASATEVIRPLAEFGTSEATCSLAWFHSSNRVIACGMLGKAIKVYDLRDPTKIVNSNFTKCIYGLCTNRNDDRYLASYTENQIAVWDIRNFDKAVTMIPQTKPIVKIAWCPTKMSCMACLTKDSTQLVNLDIHHTIVSGEEVEPTVLERPITPGSPHTITSFSWHPTDNNRMLTIALSGTIRDYKVPERIAIDWGADGQLVWTDGASHLKCLDESCIDSLTNKMKKRAKDLYGLQVPFEKNAELVQENPSLVNVWNWLQHNSKLVEGGVISTSDYKHPGAAHVLSNINVESNKSELVTIPWADLGYPSSLGAAKYYRHELREQTLHLCGWPIDRDAPFLEAFLEDLEKAGAYTRAAAMAVFHLKISQAIDILSRAPDNTEYGSSLNVVAMALSGFSDDPNSVWRKNCLPCIENLKDPYLKTMFAFLTTDNENYDSVLDEKGIAVDDRVALATIYLPDDKIHEYMQKLIDEVCKDGNLDGLLVTGNSADGLNLLQSYLNHTADVQTVSVIAMRAFHKDLKSDTVDLWFENYREILNRWRFYYERAMFDIMLQKFMNEKPPRQVFLSCNYCGKSISEELGQGKSQGQRPSTSKGLGSTSCPNCRKPLPRCAICLMYLGGATPESDPVKPSDMLGWFTWCQTCRHGGHAGHINAWFDKKIECPVSGCSCRCRSLDAAVL